MSAASISYPLLQGELSQINYTSPATSAKPFPSSKHLHRENPKCYTEISFILQQTHTFAIPKGKSGCSSFSVARGKMPQKPWDSVRLRVFIRGSGGLFAHIHHLQKFQCSLGRDIWHLTKGPEGYISGFLFSVQTDC